MLKNLYKSYDWKCPKSSRNTLKKIDIGNLHNSPFSGYFKYISIADSVEIYNEFYSWREIWFSLCIRAYYLDVYQVFDMLPMR